MALLKYWFPKASLWRGPGAAPLALSAWDRSPLDRYPRSPICAAHSCPEHRAFQNVELPPRPISPGSILALAGFLGLCLLVGLSDSAITRASVHGWFLTLRHPPGTPPNWVFPVVWTASYTLMATAAWLVWRKAGIARRLHYRALRLWGWQLLANALWTPAFFGLHQPAFAMAIMLAMDALVAATLLAFRRLEPLAAWLMAPYLAWGAYAAWLNAGLWWLNRG